MHRIGVVGPSQSVTAILEYALDIPTELSFYPFPYEKMTEIEAILTQNDDQVDFWLFSGYMPYAIAQKTIISKEKFEFVYTFGEAVFPEVLQKAYEIGHLPNGVSIDFLKYDNEPAEMMRGYVAILDNYHSYAYDEYLEMDELYRFHYNLWKSGDVEFVITTQPNIQKRLSEHGIPAFWMGPKKTDIYRAIQLLNEKIKTRYYKGAQATAIMLQVNKYQSLKTAKNSGYKIHLMDIDIKRILIQVSEQVSGSLVENGLGNYTIFTTRGIVERKYEGIVKTLHRVEIEYGCTLSVGIGSATTVYEAEKYANQALQHIQIDEKTQIFFMEDDGSIYEFKKKAVKYNTRSEMSDYTEKLAKTNISNKTFSKIQATIQELGWQNFTSKDLATQLNMTNRNAQRIMAELIKVNLVEVCGEENRNVRGRPMKIYQLNI